MGCWGQGVLREGGGDAGEDARHGFVDLGIREQFCRYIDKGDINGKVSWHEVPVQAIGLTDAPAHLHAVDSMAKFLFRNCNQKLRAAGGTTGMVHTPDGTQRVGHNRLSSGIATVK